MFPNFPKLKILPIASLLLHEEHDRQRSLPLAEKLRSQGILRNPPIVMAFEHDSDLYVVLDGANRVTALQEMQFPHIVAQVVRPDDPKVTLRTWNHVIWGMNPADLLDWMHKANEVTLTLLDQSNPGPMQSGYIPMQVQFLDNRTFLVRTTSDPVQQINCLHNIVDCYKERSSFDRTDERDVNLFQSIHPDLTALVIFPHFEIPTMLALASQGHVFPTGITRFTVSPRALHIDYPLERLAGDDSLKNKEIDLDRWIQERLQHKHVRHYTEETFMFDE